MPKITKQERLEKQQKIQADAINAEFDQSRQTWSTRVAAAVNFALKQDAVSSEMLTAGNLVFSRIKLPDNEPNSWYNITSLDIYMSFPQFQEDGQPTSVEFRKAAMYNLEVLESWVACRQAEQAEELRIQTVRQEAYKKLLEHFNEEELRLLGHSISQVRHMTTYRGRGTDLN